MAKLTQDDKTVNFRRKTFSLTEYHESLLSDLKYKHVSIKASESDLVKAGLELVKDLKTEKLIEILKDVYAKERE